MAIGAVLAAAAAAAARAGSKVSGRPRARLSRPKKPVSGRLKKLASKAHFSGLSKRRKAVKGSMQAAPKTHRAYDRDPGEGKKSY
jgi:hypothetical protein